MPHSPVLGQSKVPFEIEPLSEVVKLTVVHDGFESGSVVASMVSHGWPGIISSVKALLETGEILPTGSEPAVPARIGLSTHQHEKVAGR